MRRKDMYRLPSEGNGRRRSNTPLATIGRKNIVAEFAMKSR